MCEKRSPDQQVEMNVHWQVSCMCYLGGGPRTAITLRPLNDFLYPKPILILLKEQEVDKTTLYSCFCFFVFYWLIWEMMGVCTKQGWIGHHRGDTIFILSGFKIALGDKRTVWT